MNLDNEIEFYDLHANDAFEPDFLMLVLHGYIYAVPRS